MAAAKVEEDKWEKKRGTGKEKGLRRRREQMEKEEGRERVRRRGSSYYKWQSLPGAYDKGYYKALGPPPPPPPPQ